MRIVVKFDDTLMRRYVDRGAPPLLGIWFEEGGESYPEEGWLDFGAVILLWWVSAILRLFGGSREEDLVFMDGPFRVRVRRDRASDAVALVPEGVSFTWRATLGDLARALICAIETAADEMARLQIDPSDQAKLREGARLVRNALASHSN